MRPHPVLVALLVLAAAPAAARATTLTVSSGADGGAGSLRALVAGAGGSDTIVVPDPHTLPGAPATYVLTSGEIPLTKALTIRGPGPRKATIDADGTGRVFRVSEPTASTQATISGLTLTGGSGQGGGFAARGGAILVTRGSLNLFGAALTGNHVVATTGTVGHGGALDVDAEAVDAAAVVNQVLVAHNTLLTADGNGFGGGLSATRGLSVIASTITDNTVTSTGAGTARGGGVATYPDAMGTDQMAAGAQLANVTLARDAAVKTGAGGAIGGNLSSNALAPVSLKTTIVTGGDATTSGDDCGGATILTDSTSIIATTNATCPAGADQHAAPKLEGQLRDNGGQSDTIRPQDGSPAIGHASTFGDQRGELSTGSGPYETGAYQRVAGTAFTGLATTTGPTTAHLTGSVTTLGPSPRAFFEYGPDDAHLTATPPQTISQGTDVPVTADVGGLSPSTFYVVRLVSASDDGAGRGNQSAFQTDQTPTDPPTRTPPTGPGPDTGTLPDLSIPPPTTLPPDTTPHLAPGLFGSHVSPSRPRRGTRPTLVVRLSGSDPATVVVTLERARTGHRKGSRCVPGGGHGTRCTTYVAVGRPTTLKAVRSSASLKLPKLGSGHYRLRLSATTTAGKRGSLTLGLTTRA